MKKSKIRKRERRIPRKEIRRQYFLASEWRSLNAAKTTLTYRDGNDKIVAKTVIYEGGDCRIVSWFDHRYYVIPFHSRHLYAKPYRMTLAKYKQLNGNLAK